MKSHKHPDYIIAQKNAPVRRGAFRNEFIKIVFSGYKNYITFYFRCQEKSALALEKGTLSLPKYLVICICIWNSIYDKDIILIYFKKNSNIC